MRHPGKIQQKLNRWRIGRSRGNQRRIEALRGAHRGKQCVVLATGPSLRETDLSLLTDHPYVFGVNGAFKFFPKFKYYFCSGPEFYFSNEALIRGVRAEKFFFSSRIPFHNDSDGVYLTVREDRRSIAAAGRFESDLHRALYWGPTVLLDLVFPAALWMGFSEIVLAGADYSLFNYRHFYDRSERRMIYQANPEPERMLAHEGFATLLPYLANLGVRVYNCSPFSDLTCFRKCALEDVIGVPV